MKNIQVIDGAMNSEYAIFRVSDELFHLIFPEAGQDIEFIEDAVRRMGKKQAQILNTEICQETRVPKTKVRGIHGTLFYQLKKEKKMFYPNKRESDLEVNYKIRRLRR